MNCAGSTGWSQFPEKTNIKIKEARNVLDQVDKVICASIGDFVPDGIFEKTGI